ncbi:MAG: long-chain fatty acid--CoA ligase [Nitrospinae bacterium RIFCSPLOWO2_01_FULL_39_10]|nr:MAG: long-chain fatty acid--CoA ligase [Nitrospinae bacterium RIFCSPLOWO2_01_FULL_39_10]
MQKQWLEKYPADIPPSIEYPNKTIADFLSETAEKFSQKRAIIFFGKKINYKELHSLTIKFANALVNMGVKKGDRVAIMLPNCPHEVIAYYSVLKIGAIVVQFNPLYTERETEYQLNDSDSEIIIILDVLYKNLKNIINKTPIKNIILCSISDFLPFPKNIIYRLKERNETGVILKEHKVSHYIFSKLIKKSPAKLVNINISPDDIALLQYTGGTTGIPKGAILTHGNLVANTIQCRHWFSKAEVGKETFLSVLPFFHIFGMTSSLNLPVHLASSMILLPRFKPLDVLKAIERYRASIFIGVPAMFSAINGELRHEKKYNLSSMKFCVSGAAPLPHDMAVRFETLTDVKVIEGYGLTEASPVTHCNPIYGERKFGSIGIPLPDTECSIVDLITGAELQTGEIGEIAIKGPQIMKGYWNNEKETDMVLKNGWLFTGDIGRMDEDGYFYIVDRKKEMIISGGYNIYPREIEEVLNKHPKVKESAVIGIPYKSIGDIPKAFIVLKDGESADEDEIISYCTANLTKYKVPKKIEFRKELPKSLIGKVLKKVLKEDEKIANLSP